MCAVHKTILEFAISDG